MAAAAPKDSAAAEEEEEREPLPELWVGANVKLKDFRKKKAELNGVVAKVVALSVPEKRNSDDKYGAGAYFERPKICDSKGRYELKFSSKRHSAVLAAGSQNLVKRENLDLIPDKLHWIPDDGEGDDALRFELDAGMIYQHGFQTPQG